MGLVENILSYYLVEMDNEGVRISCYVFSVIVWIMMVPAFFFNITSIKEIINTPDVQYNVSRLDKVLFIIFFYYNKILVLARQILFLAYYPSIIFISQDKMRFY
jgi:hypothetical protein